MINSINSTNNLIKFQNINNKNTNNPEKNITKSNLNNNKENKSDKTKQALIILSGWWGISKGEEFIKKRIIGKKLAKSINKHFNSLNSIPREKVNEIAKDMISTHELDKKGFEYFYLNGSLDAGNAIVETKFEKELLKLHDKISSNKEIKEELLKDKQLKNFILYPQKTAKTIAQAITGTLVYKINGVRLGKNAFYHPLINTAFCSERRSPLMLHEIGHAVTYNALNTRGKIFHILSELSTTKLFIPAIFLVSALHKKKEDKDKNKSLLEKTKDFIQNNPEKLTFIAFAPSLIDEAKASINALKFAKKGLDHMQYNTLKKVLTFTYGSYILGAAITAASVKFGLFVKNKLSDN